MNKAYINATVIQSACGDTQQTLEAIYNNKTALKPFDDIVPDKTVCIAKFPNDEVFENLLDDALLEILQSSNLTNFSNTLLLVGSSVGGMATTEKVFFHEKSSLGMDGPL